MKKNQRGENVVNAGIKVSSANEKRKMCTKLSFSVENFPGTISADSQV